MIGERSRVPYSYAMSCDGQLSLMLVEDDPNIRYLMETAAARSGVFEVVAAAEDGQAALETLRAMDAREWPDLIITDLSMPRLSGLELLRAIKRDAMLQSIPVAIITSSDVPNDRQLALAAGAYAFVPKP